MHSKQYLFIYKLKKDDGSTHPTPTPPPNGRSVFKIKKSKRLLNEVANFFFYLYDTLMSFLI